MEQLGRDHEVRESTPRQDQLVGSEDLREELQRNSDGSQPAETRDDAEARNDFWSIEGELHLSSSCRTSGSTPRAKRRIISNTTGANCRDLDYTYESGRVARKTYQRLPSRPK